MKYWLMLAAAVLVVGLVMLKTKERFQPEFLDRRQIARTVATEYSSYDQRTNHMNHTPFAMGAIPGIETPFRVNQYTSYVT